MDTWNLYSATTQMDSPAVCCVVSVADTDEERILDVIPSEDGARNSG